MSLSTTREVIDALGGNRAVAEITGCTPKAVSNWRKQTRFPAHTYIAISEALRRGGLTVAPKLWPMSQAAE